MLVDRGPRVLQRQLGLEVRDRLGRSVETRLLVGLVFGHAVQVLGNLVQLRLKLVCIMDQFSEIFLLRGSLCNFSLSNCLLKVVGILRQTVVWSDLCFRLVSECLNALGGRVLPEERALRRLEGQRILNPVDQALFVARNFFDLLLSEPDLASELLASSLFLPLLLREAGIAVLLPQVVSAVWLLVHINLNF